MRSDTVTKGKQQAPHRSLFNALGMTQEEMDRPLVGIVSSYNEIVPGHMNLDKIVNAVKQGVAMVFLPYTSAMKRRRWVSLSATKEYSLLASRIIPKSLMTESPLLSTILITFVTI